MYQATFKKRVKVLMYATLMLWCIFAIFPFLWAFVTSFKTDQDVVNGATYFPGIDFKPVLSAWTNLFSGESIPILGPYLNTVIISITSSLLAMMIGSLAAYGLSRFRFNFGRFGNDDISFWFISLRIMPAVVIAIPYFVMFNALHLLDTKISLIIVYIGYNMPLVVWLMKDFFDNIPSELDEAAIVDGCSHFGAFFRIVVPLSKSGLLVTFLFCIIFSWSEFIFALILTINKSQTLPLVIIGRASTRIPWWEISAASLLSILPVAVLAIVIERYMIKGTLMGSFR